MASRYRGGADLERAAKQLLEDNGYYVVRSAGSKGIVDLVGLKAGEILLVQAKTDGYLSPADRGALARLRRQLNATTLVVGWMKHGNAARYPRFREVNAGGGVGPWIPDWAIDA